MATIDLGYTPQPKQKALHECPANEILYGGAAGPGKSHALRFEVLSWCLRIPGLQAYLFRRTFPELEKNHIIPSQVQFPKGIGVYKSQSRRWEFINGSMLHFCHCQHENDVFQYQGAEIHLLAIDELTSFTELQYDYLRGRVRCTLPVPEKYRHKVPGIVCSSNPGGVGHAFAKSRWVDFAPAMTLKRAPRREGGMLRCYIPGKLTDNPILMQTDPGYIDRLDALPEPYRTAYKDGDWDIFLGQMFAFNRMHHVVKPIPIPEHAPLYFTFDWGFGAPFSIGWWWSDGDGRIYRFAEWYGWNGTPNVGLRLTDSEIAEGIVKREDAMGISGRQITRLCDPTCFNKKPDYKGGGQGPSTAEEFMRKGVILSPGDPSRKLKIRQFHQRLKTYDDMPPMMLIYETCEQFIRTIPLLQADVNNIEDVNTDSEDHIYDESALLALYRPIAMTLPAPKQTFAERDFLKVQGREDEIQDPYDDGGEDSY
jgi:hypothetical protein